MFNSHEEALEQYRKDAAAKAMYSNPQYRIDGVPDSVYEGIDPDQWYYDAIEQYRGTSYYDYLLSNPHLRWNNADFSPNALQGFLEAFGDYSARDKYYGNLRSLANQFLTDATKTMRQEAYDAASSQVGREKAAGVNVDLSGGQGITPGASAENDQPAQVPEMSSSSVMSDIASLGIDFVTNVFSMAEGIQGMIGKQADIVAQDIANHTSAMGFVQDELMNTIDSDALVSPDRLDDDVILSALDDLASDTSFHHSTRKVIKRYRNELFENSGKMNTLRTELAERYLKSRKGVVSEVADPFYEKKLTDWIGKIGDYFTLLANAAVSEAGAKAAKGSHDEAYYNEHDGFQQAETENQELKERKTASENRQSPQQVMNELVKFLQEDDSLWSKFGLFLLPKINAFLDTLSQGSLRLKIDNSSSTSSTQSTTYKTGPTVINN